LRRGDTQPTGGVKDSGLDREGCFEALRFFTEEKKRLREDLAVKVACLRTWT